MAPAIPALGTADDIIGLAAVGFFLPAAVLSAVNPIVVKLQLRDLDVTGQVVGRLSAVGTAGAILGTFVAGFVLVAAAATSTVIIAVGAALVLAGLVLWVGLARPRPPAALLVVTLAVVAGAGTVGAVSDGPCDVETRYHCARIIPDPARPGGRSLWLDITRHSYVDLNDPRHIELRYAKNFVDVIAAARPPAARAGRSTRSTSAAAGSPCPATSAPPIPGPGMWSSSSIPTWSGWPANDSASSPGPNLRVESGDARLLTRRLPDDSQDLVVGDAFGDLSVPWHLTTREFLTDVRRRDAPRRPLRPQPHRLPAAALRPVRDGHPGRRLRSRRRPRPAVLPCGRPGRQLRAGRLRPPLRRRPPRGPDPDPQR